MHDPHSSLARLHGCMASMPGVGDHGTKGPPLTNLEGIDFNIDIQGHVALEQVRLAHVTRDCAQLQARYRHGDQGQCSIGICVDRISIRTLIEFLPIGVSL